MPVGSGDRWADDYERGRPGWPASAITVAGVSSDAAVLDLGAGTGKLTRQLLAHFERVIAVEPADAMRRVLEAVCPAAESYAGTADAIPLADASVGAVYAAQAFHWFDDERSAREIRRVLRAGGVLVAMFNGPGAPVEPPIDDVLALLRERSPDVVDYDPLDLNTGGRRTWRGSRRSRTHGSRTRRRSTAKGSSPSTHRWGGSATCPTTSGLHCSTACAPC